MNPEVCAVQLRAAVMHLSRRLRAGMQRDGLPAAMLSVLGQLHRGGHMTPTELAGREGVKLQSLTRLLAELESFGWILRTVHVADARQSMLAISPQGKKRLGAAAKGADVPLAHAIAAGLSQDEQALLVRASALLARLGDALQGPGDPT
jgi:DNA-binding MarR family transcriptional regulator